MKKVFFTVNSFIDNFNKPCKFRKVLILILFISIAGQAQTINESGIPFITNWSPKDYDSHRQNWNIVQDNRGVMYFANGNGVLEYDGVNWRTISLPKKSWVLSLAFDTSDGRIYVGAETEFGYLSPDSSGEMQYISLMANVPEQYRDFGEVWQTLFLNDEIYFSTRKYLFCLISNSTGNQNEFQILKAENSFHVSFLVRNKIFTRQRETGLMELVNDSLRLVPGGERFANDGIYSLLPFENNRILVCTRSLGMFLYDGKTFQPFPTQADDFLLKNQVYHGAVLADGTFAIATLRGGLAIIDKTRKITSDCEQNLRAKG